MTDAATSAGLGMAMSAAFIYLVLRAFAGNPAAPHSTEGISRHAFWTAVIAFFASGTSGLQNLWANGEQLGADAGSFESLAMHAAAPGCWLGAIYLIGQYTWPRHLQPVRSASLEVRSARKVVPKYLAGVLLLVTILSAAAIAIAWNDAGAPSRTDNGGPGWTTQNGMYHGGFDGNGDPVDLPYDGATDQYGNPVDAEGYLLSEEQIEEMNSNAALEEVPGVSGIEGTRPGSVVGPYLAGGLALVLAGVVWITALVIRRPPLQSLDPEGNDVLRGIWLNRLLRTAVIAVSGFGAMSLQYIAQGVSARASWELPADLHSLDDSHAEAAANWLTGASTVWMLVAVLAMAAWAPPRLGASVRTMPADVAPHSVAYTRARDFLLLAQCVGLLLVVLAFGSIGLLRSYGDGGTFAGIGQAAGPIGEAPYGESPWMAGFDVAATADDLVVDILILASAACAYLLVQWLAARVLRRRLSDGTTPEEPHTALLPLWFTLVVYCALAAGLTSATNFAFNAIPDLKTALAWVLGIVAATAALALLLHRTAARRPAIDGAGEQEDFELRVLVAHRGARLLGGVSLLSAGILANPDYLVRTTYSGYTEYPFDSDPSAFQLACLLLGLALCLLPASTAYRRRASKQRSGAPANA